MTEKLHAIPKAPTERALLFEPCPQVIDGKIYFFERLNERPKDGPPIRQVLAFDLGILRFFFFFSLTTI